LRGRIVISSDLYGRSSRSNLESALKVSNSH
jgi:hypothetical protein